ncbi:PepSY domain-containing protein [Candidatus Woesearchaeota archaeon]|nr:PepSY domain-containing protein [Candidatus Woesearchaeota archaeon]
MAKKRPIAANSKLIFAAIVLILLAAVILSTNSSITGNVFAKIIQKASTTQITAIKSISNVTGNTSNGTSSAVTSSNITGSAAILESAKLVKIPATATGEDMLVPLEGVRRILTIGETWSNFAFGYDIRVLSIDARASPKQVLIAVYKNGTLKDDAIVNESKFYDYVEGRYMNYSNLIIFRINMSRVFAGSTSDMVDLKENYVSSIAVNACNPEWGCYTGECLNYKIKRENCADSNSCHKSEGQPPAIESCQGNKTLSTGQTWALDYDSSLQAISIDARASPKQAWLALTSRYSPSGQDSGIGGEGELFEIAERWRGYDNVTVFSTRIDSIYAGAASDMARFKDTYILSADLCACEQLWRCGAWSSCVNSVKTRACIDLSNCSSNWSASDLEINCNVGLPLTALPCVPSVADTGTAVMRNATVYSSLNLSGESQNASITAVLQNQTLHAAGQSQTQASGITVEEAAEITVEKESEDKTIIRRGNSVVETQLDITEESLQLYINSSEGEENKIIFPDRAISKIRESGTIKKAVLEKENGRAVYHIYATKKVKLFLIFSASLNEEIKIDAESGEVIETKTPWWAFLTK